MRGASASPGRWVAAFALHGITAAKLDRAEHANGPLADAVLGSHLQRDLLLILLAAVAVMDGPAARQGRAARPP